MIKEEKISANNYILSSPAGERKYQQQSLIVNITVIQQFCWCTCTCILIKLFPFVNDVMFLYNLWRNVGLDIYPGINSPNKWDLLQAGRSETGCCFDEFNIIMRFYQNRLKKKLWISLSSWSTISVLVKCTIYEHFVFFLYL